MSPDTKLELIPGKLMLIDDNPGHLDLFMLHFEALGVDASSFNNPREALRVLQDNPDGFWSALTDGDMPDMDGRIWSEAAKNIKPSLLIFLHSDRDRPAIRERFGEDIGKYVMDYRRKEPDIDVTERIVECLARAYWRSRQDSAA